MPTKPIDRLLFAQGGQCFFCNQPIPPGQATVEHLVASANGGTNDAQNCVVCCKTLNTLLGRMSLKEKIRVVLNQKGAFRCPNGNRTAPKSKPAQKTPKTARQILAPDERLEAVLADLHKRGAARPRSVKTLTGTISALFQNALSDQQIQEVIDSLQSKGIVLISDTKVSYDFPKTDA